ncbi:hypothetical protein DVA67_006475 [Solirubrobacter sp. CPCC 204708]|uniref:CARDB domain-containing protein n=1 Tax=Solirubrobacter deserti TaxID=2282478 RepID=A0ABT4RCJ5_9ACTN|nr:hypothetical protein [Solirubrobacter deserti]MBE2315613.1 hypothetical protein [Solirubrobacter deserti]MDA0136252.1 hypothetical protein [Solirubrobacter deserti]
MAARGLLAAIIAFVVIAAPAEATIRKGSIDDQPQDTNTSGHDILQAVGVSDDKGAAAIAIRVGGTPATSALVSGALGTRAQNGTCGAPFAVFTGMVGNENALFARDTDTRTTFPARLVVEGTTVTIAAQDAARLNLPFDCAYASTRNVNNVLYDETAEFGLEVEAPPAATPTATPSPTPTAVPPAPVPAPTTATAPPVQVPKEAKLTVSLTGTPTTIKRNRAMKLKLKVANDGSKRSSKVSVSVGKARGLSVSKVKAFKALDPAKSKTVTLKVTLGKKAKAETTLKVTVKAGKLKQTSSVLLKIGKAKKITPGKTVPAPEAKKSPIVGTYWWRTVNHVDWAWDNRALYFVDGGAVYSGFPAGGLPTTCTTPVQSPEDEFDTREGCLAYSFDEKTGAVTIGDKTGTFANGKLTIDGQGYYATQIPPAGTRFSFFEHKHVDFNGMCGMYLGCSVTQKFLSMSPDGKFILSRSTTTTMGDPGMGPFTAIGSYPPDQHGTYEVLAGGKIQLSYADGTVKVETFAVDTNHETDVPDPVGEGVLIGEDNFYPDPFPEID